RQLYGGRLIAENRKIKLLREFCDTVEVARAMLPNGVKDLVQKDKQRTRKHNDKNTRLLLLNVWPHRNHGQGRCRRRSLCECRCGDEARSRYDDARSGHAIRGES